MRMAASFAMAAGLCFGQNSFNDIEARVSEFSLSNGMKFIVFERNLAPVVSFRLYADVGAAQELPGLTGTAHMVEHMAFKGTSTLGTTDYEKEKPALDKVDAAFVALREERLKGPKADPARLTGLEEDFRRAQEEAGKFALDSDFSHAITTAGGRGMNANTSEDGTSFYYNLPSNAIELWFWLESQRFRDPVFRQFYEERAVVMQERRLRVDDSPLGKLFEEFLKAAFTTHPYGRPVLGHMRDLETLDRQSALAFFKKYYQAGNLTAVMVGNVNVNTVKRLAEKYFGDLPAGQKPPPVQDTEPPQKSERITTIHLSAPPMLCMGYHKPSMNDPDGAAYEVLNSVLSQGRTARFNRRLIQDQRVVTRFQGMVSYPSGKYANLLSFCLTPAPGKTNEHVISAVTAELERIKSEGVTEEEVEGAEARFRAAFLYQLKDDRTIAGQLARWQVLTGSWRNLFRYLEKIAAVKPEDVQRVAQKSLNRNNLTIAKIEPPVGSGTK